MSCFNYICAIKCSPSLPHSLPVPGQRRGPATGQPCPCPHHGCAAFPANPGRERGWVTNPSLEQMAGGSVTQLAGPVCARP